VIDNKSAQYKQVWVGQKGIERWLGVWCIISMVYMPTNCTYWLCQNYRVRNVISFKTALHNIFIIIIISLLHYHLCNMWKTTWMHTAHYHH